MPARPDRMALVTALRAVPGVLDATLEPDREGGPGALRLDLAPGADGEAVAGEVDDVLRREFGLGVDAERLASSTPADLVDADPHGAAAPAAASEPGAAEEAYARQGGRPSIAKLHLVSEGLEATASVTLAAGVRQATGTATGIASSNAVHRTVATATLRAVEQLVGPALRVELEQLELVPVGPERTVLVVLALVTARGSELLTGASAVRDDVRQAVVRATLDALNRRLERLTVEV